MHDGGHRDGNGWSLRQEVMGRRNTAREEKKEKLKRIKRHIYLPTHTHTHTHIHTHTRYNNSKLVRYKYTY